jgi:hypothetical protein
MRLKRVLLRPKDLASLAARDVADKLAARRRRYHTDKPVTCHEDLSGAAGNGSDAGLTISSQTVISVFDVMVRS